MLLLLYYITLHICGYIVNAIAAVTISAGAIGAHAAVAAIAAAGAVGGAGVAAVGAHTGIAIVGIAGWRAGCTVAIATGFIIAAAGQRRHEQQCGGHKISKSFHY